MLSGGINNFCYSQLMLSHWAKVYELLYSSFNWLYKNIVRTSNRSVEFCSIICKNLKRRCRGHFNTSIFLQFIIVFPPVASAVLVEDLFSKRLLSHIWRWADTVDCLRSARLSEKIALSLLPIDD